MTLSQVTKRLAKLEQTVDRLVNELDYRQSVEAIREGLKSVDRGEGRSAASSFAKLRRKLNTAKSH
ncbi:MAG TPA: hypothetical protein VHD56_01295 [Tepidisphaeraceae bacterium]|nr:hypothetical protein [Tepidisphaeraceae bacterium]